MIVANGMVYDTSQQEMILSTLETRINETRTKAQLDPELVISAFDRLSRGIESGEFPEFSERLRSLHEEEAILQALRMFRRDCLTYKLKAELGSRFFEPKLTGPPLGFPRVQVDPRPLGTLLHIAAGNMDILPAYSVAEGLLTGNINILKLPSADNGITVQIFELLLTIEPRLRDYVYIFDTPSEDIAAIKRMAAAADGIAVWGGDAAISAVRRLAPTGCRLIEWGHRLGFAYISGYENKEQELTDLAEHITMTKQLLCSSCQVIYLDTMNMNEVADFCKMFLPYLERAAEKYPVKEVGAVAEMTLRRYSDMLECTLNAIKSTEGQVFQGKLCSLTASYDGELELSYMYGNVIVKRLPEEKMMDTLRKSKGYLQTAGLITTAARRERLTELLIRCGVNRVMRAGNMSDAFLGEAHDGEYALRRYTRIVNVAL